MNILDLIFIIKVREKMCHLIVVSRGHNCNDILKSEYIPRITCTYTIRTVI